MNFYKKYQSIRKEKGFTIEDISNHTKIDGKYFILIEKGKFAEISPVYLKLFFKAYVNFLNLEEKENVVKFFVVLTLCLLIRLTDVSAHTELLLAEQQT